MRATPNPSPAQSERSREREARGFAAHPSDGPLLEVRALTVEYFSNNGTKCLAVADATFQVGAGEIVGIFGKSGAGKTSLGLALLNLLPAAAKRRATTLRFDNRDLLTLKESEMRSVRGRDISIMFQEPALALNPVMRVGDQIAEVIRAHHKLSSTERRERVCSLLRDVRLDRRRGILEAYPHELSGGERHRVVIAQALACNPSLVIADEPTAGLDAELRLEIVDLIEQLRSKLNCSFLVISHHRDVLARIADRTLKMSAGHLREVSIESLAPSSLRHCATGKNSHAEDSSSRWPLVSICGLSKSYRKRGVLFRSHSCAPVLHDVNLAIPCNSTLALIGPSGSGKSTLARCLALWERPDAGEIVFRGRNVVTLSASEARRLRPRIQLVLQDSAAAVNPNFIAEEIIEEPLLIQDRGTKRERRTELIRLLEEVGLREEMLTRKALEFSAGQRQRLAIARALVLSPELIIFDESTSGLDVETQQQIIALLTRLKVTRNLTYLVISHDLGLVNEIADQVAIMRHGTVISVASVAEAQRAGDLMQPETEPKALASGENK
jgi:peptide/nickel transport system ATP-binding protein